MSGSMVDIQSAIAEIRRGKKERRRRQKKPQDKNIMACPIPQGGHNYMTKLMWLLHLSAVLAWHILSKSTKTVTMGGHNLTQPRCADGRLSRRLCAVHGPWSLLP